jgi:cytoskeletal protein RodZ
MSNDGDYVERVVEEPATVRREEVRVVRESSNAGWWIAALVAVVAIVGVIFLMNNSNSQADLQNARTEGAAQQALSTASSDAQMAASQAAQSAQSAAQSTASATENAARAAADRTAQAADTAANAARDATTTEPAPPN